MITPFAPLICPLDAEPLERGDTALRCPAGHTFDLARQGYVNLLPVQHKRSRDPGDSKAMVAARGRFLAAGHYRPLAAAVSAAVLDARPAQAPLACLDAGCGEGYYLRELAAAAEALTPPASLSLLGLDVSKWAIAAAARADARPTWLVASNARIPVPPGSVQALICAFGFPVYEEFVRVLSPGGRLILLEPAADHLRELRERLYPSLKPARTVPVERHPALVFEGEQELRYPISLDSQQRIADLLAMTPHLYRAPAEGLARVGALEQLTVTVDVRLRRYRAAPL